MFSPEIVPVGTHEAIKVPAAWLALEGTLDPDLFERGIRYNAFAHRLSGVIPQATRMADDFLGIIARGFSEPFNPAPFQPALDDPDFDVKTANLNAIIDLACEFEGRVPNVVWETYAFLGTRPDPQQYATIMTHMDRLPHAYWVCDSVLHAMGKVYGLSMHMQSRVHAATGGVIEHNCDCGCDWRPTPESGMVRQFIEPERIKLATAALLSHLFGESFLIGILGMPFNLGLSPEAAEVLGHEPASALA